MSKSLIEFLEKIHVPAETITKLQADEATDVTDLTKSYLDSRNSYYESTMLKDKTDAASASTAKGMVLKAIKKINEISGMALTNTQMEEYKDLDSFVVDAKKFIEVEKAKNANASNAELITELDKWKVAATSAQKTADDVASQMESFKTQKDSEFNQKVQEFEARQFWLKMINEDSELPDVPHKNFAISAIEKEIFESYKIEVVKDVNGKVIGTRLLNKDGSKANHPDTAKQVTVDSLSEIYPFFKSKAGLIKLSNAGKDRVGPDGKVIVSDKPGPAEQAFLDQLEANRKLQ